MRAPDYERGNVRLYCGDCLELLPQLEAGSVDCVVTDPPYGIDFSSHGQLFRGTSRISGDTATVVARSIAEWCAVRDRTPIAMFFSPYKWLNLAWRSILVWSKGAHVGIGGDRETCWKRDFELIGVRDNLALNGGRDSAVISMNALSPPPTGHVAEKPVGLLRYLVGKMSNPGQCVVDPCMGTGTTGVAAIEEGRSFIGMEVDPHWFSVAVRRIDAAIDQYALLDPVPAAKQMELLAPEGKP